MKRGLVTLILAALSASILATAAWAGDDPRLSSGGQARFPDRSFLLSLPGDAVVDPAGVRVTENGEPVHELDVVPARKAGAGQLGTVLVVDASSSMRGKPIARALAAARTFATYRQADQKIGVVMFNRKGWTALDPTTDGGLIDRALSRAPRLAAQARIYDGVNLAVGMLEKQRLDVGSVILLSDCATTCEDGKLGAPASGAMNPAGGARSVSSSALVARAKGRGVRVFTVGLRPKQSDAGTLRQLAAATGGDYSAASSAEDLKGIYGRLGARIANEYIVSYSSVAGRGARVRVEATAEGVAGTATLTYSSPKLAAPAAPPPAPEANGFWGSPLTMVIVSFGVAFFICFAIASIAVRHQRGESVDQRVAAFVAMGEVAPDGDRERREGPTGLSALLDRALRGKGWWQRFCVEVDVGRVGKPPAQIAAMTVVATVALLWLFPTVSGAGWTAIFALAVPVGVRSVVAQKCRKQRTLFGEQLADNLQVLASAMRAGQSFGGALSVAVMDAPEPARRELHRVVADERLGVPPDQSLSVVCERMDNRDLQQVVMVASLQREAGGNSAEVLDRVADTIRERVALRRLVSTLTAQGRLSRWVVTLLPVGVVMFIGLTRPNFLDPLLYTGTGNALLVLAILMVAAGSFAIKRIVDIRV